MVSRAGVVRAGVEGREGRVPVLAAVTEPSSLAVELAEEAGVALVGFLRGLTMTFYAHARRVRTRDRPAHETVAGPEQVGIRVTTGRSRTQPKYVDRPLQPHAVALDQLIVN
jgi:hypothetical protein